MRTAKYYVILPLAIYLYYFIVPIKFLSNTKAVTIDYPRLVAGIDCPTCFLIFMRLHGDDKHMQPGKYMISNTTTYNSLRQDIIAGSGYVEFLTIPEGASKQDIITKIKQHKNITQTNTSMSLQAIPTTIRFSPGAADETVMAIANSFHNKVINNVRNSCPSYFQDKFEVVASIIQKESAYKIEYPFIAAVIYNRIKQNMRLQVDVEPNSYHKLGLPDQPISAPSIEALKAACQPAKVDWLYYVALGKRHIFSSNYADHLQIVNRRKYVHQH